ncbi:hypothetical protein BD410DRAFT_751831 [Rickenella mellea]|uniref:RNA-binding protein VTS1 n=1 Tax=Rickenella mellea TaxID=50990 RepID=A0A4Y7PX75_9AGAM|nr:hypothetical protein BD410DRAFT_751831 [Rickenella mellea]
MSNLRPPSTSPSPSPGPGNGVKTSSRASMGPSSRPAPINPVPPPASPRPGSGRPTSELLGGAGMFQTPEAEAIDQWFENLQNYEATLEEMAAASLDVNFKEELSAIEQWFRVLSEAERTAALYSLLQHSTQVQIRFFITVLQQMARSDPMTALLSPNAGGSMQSQMEAKLAQMGLKSPALKSSVPPSPSARNFSGGANPNRQSLVMDSSNSSSFLSPDSANVLAAGGNDAAATLAQQRAKLKANAAHRISAPALASTVGEGGRNVWATAGSQLSQVQERNSDSPTQELTVPSPSANVSSRPKSTDFSGLANALRSPRLSGDDEPQLSPMVGGNWASMVNTPLAPMFADTQNATGGGGQNLDAAAQKLANWQMGGASAGRITLDDAKKFRRVSKDSSQIANNAVYGDDGDLIAGGGAPQQSGNQRNGGGGGFRNPGAGNNSGNSSFLSGQAWNGGAGAGGGGGARSPALSNVSSGRFGGSDDGSALNGMNPGGFGMGMPSPGLGMGMAGLAGMGQLNPFNMNMNMLSMANLGAMGLTPEAQAQILAAQMAASGFVQPGMSPFGMGMQAQQQQQGMRGGGGMGGGSGGSARGSSGGRGPGKPSSARESGKDKDEEVDPTVLNDVPAWLRSLRLHKYTPNFEGMNWKDMVMMDEVALEAKGVAALGARRKMLKTFEAVRNKMGIDMPGSAPATAASV